MESIKEKTGKERADKLVFERGLADSREKARALIMAGQIVAGDHLVEKPGQMLPVVIDIRSKGDVCPYVSRGGLKLAKALDEFGICVDGKTAIDVGASTGGFTDCLLQNGAARVIAVDVGYGQLAWKLRQDERVVNLEKTNIRHLSPEALPFLPEVAVIDASFISLDKVLPGTLHLIADDGEIVALIKPQFEVGKGQVGKGGVVRDEAKHRQVVESVKELAGTLGLLVVGVVESPILGPKGNKEFLIYLRKNFSEVQGRNLA